MTLPAPRPAGERDRRAPRQEVRLPQPPSQRGDVPAASHLPANFGTM